MGAAELLDYPRDKLRGLVLEEGASPAMSSIVARAMGIPVVGQVAGIVSLAKTAIRSSSTATTARSICGRKADLETAYAEKGALPRPAAGAVSCPAPVDPVTLDGVNGSSCQ